MQLYSCQIIPLLASALYPWLFPPKSPCNLTRKKLPRQANRKKKMGARDEPKALQCEAQESSRFCLKKGVPKMSKTFLVTWSSGGYECFCLGYEL